MPDEIEKNAARQRAWDSALRLATESAIRDHGSAAYVVAVDNARQSRDLGLPEGVRFWSAVAEAVNSQLNENGNPNLIS